MHFTIFLTSVANMMNDSSEIQRTFVLYLQVMYLQAFILVLLLGKVFRRIFFGQLRPAEFEVNTLFSFH